MTIRRVGILIPILLLVAPAAYGQVNYGDFLGSGVDFLQVTETTQSVGDPAVLWDAPSIAVSGTGLEFSPSVYSSACTTGSSDTTSSLLTMDVVAASGGFIDTISLSEDGDATLDSDPPFGTASTNATVTSSGTVTVVETTSGPIAPVVIPFTGTFTPSDTYALPVDFGTNNWTGFISIDVSSVVPQATEVVLAFDNTLTSNCDNFGSTSGTIQKTSITGPDVVLGDVDECVALPCQNGGICTNLPGSFSCECPPGFTGAFCEVPAGACCTDLACTIESAAGCAGLGGSYQGDQTTCDPDPCGPPPLNHFQCYDVARTQFDRVPVNLVDDFGPSVTEVRRPRLLCAPVNKNDEDPTAPDDPDHLVGYETRRTSARFERHVDEVVVDQFGALVLDLQRPERLLVPSAKSVSGPASPLDPPLVDHYQCYRVRGDRRRVPGVEVEDQFTENGSDLTDVKKPLRLCLPVDKNGEGILDGAARLMCYKTKPGPRVNREVWFDNQFGGGILEVRRARELCVPVETP